MDDGVKVVFVPGDDESMFHDPNVDSLIGAFVRPCSWTIGERAAVQQVIRLHFLEPSHLLHRVPIVRKGQQAG